MLSHKKNNKFKNQYKKFKSQQKNKKMHQRMTGKYFCDESFLEKNEYKNYENMMFKI